MARLTLPRLSKEKARIDKMRTILSEARLYLREVSGGNYRARDASLNEDLRAAEKRVQAAQVELTAAVEHIEKVTRVLEARKTK